MSDRRWNQLCETAGLDGPAGWTMLTAGYGAPSQTYHNLQHIRDCLELLDEYIHLAADPVALEFAIWFHDLISTTSPEPIRSDFPPPTSAASLRAWSAM